MRYIVVSFLCLIPCLATGCAKSVEENPKVASSKPSNTSSLSSVDAADVPYTDQCIVIQGIVSPESQSGSRRKDNARTVHFFHLAAWRRPGESVVKRDLIVLRPVQSERRYFDDFPTYSIQRMSVLLSVDGTRAVFEKSMPLDVPDKELVDFGEELRRPVIVPTKTFGDLTLNREIGWFEAKTSWNGKPVHVNFDKDNVETVKIALKIGESLWAEQSRWDQAANACVIKELLPIKNSNWLGENEKPVSESEFLGRIKLESITIHDDGSFSFWYDDGDLFFGHSIEVGGDLKDGMRYANFHG